MVFCGKFLISTKHPFVLMRSCLECFNTSSTAGISLANLKTWRRPAAFVLLVSNLVAALYTGLIHQRGTLDVMTHLHTLCNVSGIASPPQPDILFLMPCHSTPFYRYSAASHTWGSVCRWSTAWCVAFLIPMLRAEEQQNESEYWLQEQECLFVLYRLITLCRFSSAFQYTSASASNLKNVSYITMSFH